MRSDSLASAMADRNSSSASSSRPWAPWTIASAVSGEDVAARVLGHGLRAGLEREPLGLVDLAELGQSRRERGLVVGLEPTIPARRCDAEGLAEQLLGPLEVALARASQPSLSSAAASTGSMPSSSAVSRDLVHHRLGRVELALHPQEPGVRQRGADAGPDASALARELESAREQDLRLVELEADDVRGRQRLRGDRLQVLPPASSAFTYARSMYRT